jgi:hypothetical protein
MVLLGVPRQGAQRSALRQADSQFRLQPDSIASRYSRNKAGERSPWAGGGLAIQPDFVVWRDLKDGRLEALMPELLQNL